LADTVGEIVKTMMKLAPPELALRDDAIGFQVEPHRRGMNKLVRRCGVALDPSLAVIREAVEAGVSLLITHHPLFTQPVNRVDGGLLRRLKLLLDNNIALYVAHSNLDAAEGGLNDTLAEVLNLNIVDVLEVADGNGTVPLGRVCMVKVKEMKLETFADYVFHKLNAELVQYVKAREKPIEKVAVACGRNASPSLLVYSKKKGADTYLTGEFSYSLALTGEEEGVNVVSVSHYDTEKHGMKKVAQLLSIEHPEVHVLFFDLKPKVFHFVKGEIEDAFEL